MRIGLLWHDDSPDRDLAEKVMRAAQRYRQKFGASPDTCYVRHTALSDNGKTARVGAICVTVSPTVLLHHFWIGQGEKPR